MFENYKRMPSALLSKNGWSELLESQRTEEPHLHQIEPTNHCPYTCIMCPHTKMKRVKGFMDIKLYQKIIEEVASYSEPVRSKEIELYHFGESLLHPQITKMVRIASNLSLNVTLSVNAPNLSPKITEQILQNKPYRLIISFDGYDQESYSKIRGKAANFLLAVQNIEYLISYIKSAKISTIISIQIIRLHSNDKFIDQFKKDWQAHGIDVDIRDFFPWTEKDMINLGKVKKYPPFMPCPFPWQYLVVQWDGSVVPCCRDYNGTNVLGNMKDSSLKDIWNSLLYSQFRNQHRTGNYKGNSFCKDCISIYYTEDKSISSPYKTAIEETLPDFWKNAIDKSADKTLIISTEDDTVFSYKEADAIIQLFCSSLTVSGIKHGDRVAVTGVQAAEVFFIFWATVLLGAVFVPIDPALSSKETKLLINKIKPKFVFYDYCNFINTGQIECIETVVFDDTDNFPISCPAQRLSDWLKSADISTLIKPAVKPDDPAAILFTLVQLANLKELSCLTQLSVVVLH